MLMSIRVTFRLTDGTEVEDEYTGTSHEAVARLAVSRYQKANPTKRVEYVRLRLPTPITWLPHYEGWMHEQPGFIQDQQAIPAALPPADRDGVPLDPPSITATELHTET